MALRNGNSPDINEYESTTRKLEQKLPGREFRIHVLFATSTLLQVPVQIRTSSCDTRESTSASIKYYKTVLQSRAAYVSRFLRI